MEIYKKIAKAKEQIKKSDLKKEGRNSFSKYNYFTPEQVEHLVFEACQTNGLLTKFDLKRNEFGEYGILTIFDINSDEFATYEMSTAIPEIKATNIAQQLGGCVTYTERYLKMSAFGITENALDFDDKDNSKKPVKTLPELKPTDKENWSKVVTALQNGFTIDQVKTKWKLSKDNEEKLLTESI